MGSSTSGIQISSGVVTSLKYELGLPPPPRDVGRGREDEHGEQAPERDLGQRPRQTYTAFDTCYRGHADDRRGAPVHVPVALLPPDAGGGGGKDRGQRRRLRVDLAQLQGEERGDEEDPAADAEEPGENAGAEPEHDREYDRRHATRSRTPTTTRNTANASARPRVFRRCWIDVPATAPMLAGMPISNA